jgi:Transcriptional regulator, AbiEi antitoxin
MGEQLSEPLARLITRQRGVVARRQLAEAGMSPEALRWRVARGHWQRLHRGVYATFSGQPDRLAMLWAVVLYAGQGAMLSYDTAAELAKLTDKPGKLIHVTIPAERRVTKRPGVVIHRSDRAAEAVDRRRLPPQTRIEETVLDLAAAARSLDDAWSWVMRASQRRLIAPTFLAHALAQRPRIAWHAELAEVLAPGLDGLHSILELRYHRDVEKRHELPAGTRQALGRSAGRVIYRDTLYEAYQTAVELDGDAFHPADTRWRDVQRDNAAAADGITTLRYGWLDVTARPCQVAAEVARVLARRGYTAARPCSPTCAVGQAASSAPRNLRTARSV